MCGIVGCWTYSLNVKRELNHLVMRMTERLAHRGPDDSGIWVDQPAGLALGHRRLSILDPSQDGHQPMSSQSGQYVMTFNGEIYNFKALARELSADGCRFRGHSDTEVMLAAFEEWGLKNALDRFNGMFAFALWNRRSRELHLVRDRLGEKPLYYGWAGESFLFASELKAFAAHPDFKPDVDRDSVAAYLKYNCIPAPYTIYRNIRKLPPGARLHLALCRPEAMREPVPYWSPLEAARRGFADPYRGSVEEVVEDLGALLRDAIRLRMVSDVPLGAFLSGGVDSSMIVSLMQEQSAAPVRTFSIGFMEDGYDESETAAAVAHHLGTEHTNLYVSSREALDVIPLLPFIYDEPFSDSSQIPTYIVSKLARGNVTVSLSGDGGDELFGGYRRYFLWGRVWEKLGWLPSAGRRALARALGSLTAAQWNQAADRLDRLLFPLPRINYLGDKIHRLARVLAADDPLSRYDAIVSAYETPLSIVRSGSDRARFRTAETNPVEPLGFCRFMMSIDAAAYLPDDILAKLDRASMAVGLEARAPFLDHRVAEFAARLPLEMKVRGGTGKWVLRRLLEQYVPVNLTNRPKKGFSVPIANWLRGPLREWAEELLAENRVAAEGFFDTTMVRALWNDLLGMKQDVEHAVWSILVFEAWLEAAKRQTLALHASNFGSAAEALVN